MSLIRLRHERRALGARVKEPMSLVRLTLLLLVVACIIWWLGRVG